MSGTIKPGINKAWSGLYTYYEIYGSRVRSGGPAKSKYSRVGGQSFAFNDITNNKVDILP